MSKNEQSPKDYIQYLNINGLNGRLMHLPPPKGKKTEMLLVYGHHSSLERWWGIAQLLNQHVGVTMPDLPGFGGMDSFYKIGQKPDLDNMADYLASVIRLRYKRRRFSILGLSYGFVVVTRMLQRYPDLAKRCDLLVSVVGFSHHHDFKFSKPRMLFYRKGSKFFSWALPATVFRYAFLNGPWIRLMYHRTYNAKKRFEGLTAEEAKLSMDVEVDLWQSNDVRTHMFTNNEFLWINNCDRQVNLPLVHIHAKEDQYFNHYNVEQHLKVIYKSVEVLTTTSESHAPSVIANVDEAAGYLPKAAIDRLKALP